MAVFAATMGSVMALLSWIAAREWSFRLRRIGVP